MVKNGQRAHRQRMGRGAPNRQMREEVSGTQMKMRAHGQLMRHAVKMMEMMMMIMHMLPVTFACLPRTALPQMGRNRRMSRRRMKIKMMSSIQRAEIRPRMLSCDVVYMSVLCPRRRVESESRLRIDLPNLGRRSTFGRPGRVTSRYLLRSSEAPSRHQP